MKLKLSIILFVIASIITSCHQNEVFFKYDTISNRGWDKDSVQYFDIRIADKNTPYNFYIHLRNKSNYPYQNIWLFLEQIHPDKTIKKDTIEAYLADQYGKWLGTGAGSLKEMQILYQKEIHFPDTGTYRIGIKHGMRDSVLQGINDVGIRIEKTK